MLLNNINILKNRAFRNTGFMQIIFREPQSPPITVRHFLVYSWGTRKKKKRDFLQNGLCIQQYSQVEKASLSHSLNLLTFGSLYFSFGMNGIGINNQQTLTCCLGGRRLHGRCRYREGTRASRATFRGDSEWFAYWDTEEREFVSLVRLSPRELTSLRCNTGARGKTHHFQAKLAKRLLTVTSQGYHERLEKLKWLSLGNFKKSSFSSRKPHKSDGGYPFQKLKSTRTHDRSSLFPQWSMVAAPRSPHCLCVSMDPIYYD